jgi:hypothetical protein
MTQQWMLQHLSIVHCIHLRPEKSAKVSKEAASSKTGNSAAEAETAEQSLLGKESDVEESDVSKEKEKSRDVFNRRHRFQQKTLLRSRCVERRERFCRSGRRICLSSLVNNDGMVKKRGFDCGLFMLPHCC